MNRNYKGKYNQQNRMDGRENLRGWRYLDKINSSGKENIKSNKLLTQNIQDIKRQNLRIIGTKGTSNIFKKIIEMKTLPT